MVAVPRVAPAHPPAISDTIPSIAPESGESGQNCKARVGRLWAHRPELRQPSSGALGGGLPLFPALTSDAIRSLDSAGERLTLGAGDVVFAKGDLDRRAFVVLDGRVKLTLHSSAGTELQLAVVEPGELFGELSALDGQPRPFNATALDDSEVLALRPETVLTAVKSTPWLALWLVRALGEQLRAGYEFIGDTVFLDVAGRLAKKLLDLSEADDAEESETPVGIPFTQRDLAGMLGVTRETVNKNLAAFRARGAIEVRRRRIVVRHREALRRRIY